MRSDARSRWRIHFRRRRGLAGRLGFEFGQDRPQGLDTRRERVTIVSGDVGKKPVLAFVHNNRESLPRNKTESEPEKRSKLEAFIDKIRRSPVSFFTAPHELATQVTVSFVNFRERRPAVGFIRADQSVDYKKYTELLEENMELKKRLSELDLAEQHEFMGAQDYLNTTLIFGADQQQITMTRGEIFVWVADTIIEGWTDDRLIREHVCDKLGKNKLGLERAFSELSLDGHKNIKLFFEEIKKIFYSLGLIDLKGIHQTGITGTTYISQTWELTSYGRVQYKLLSNK